MFAIYEQSFVLVNKSCKTFRQSCKSQTLLAFVYSLSGKSINYSFRKNLKGSGCGKSKKGPSQQGQKYQEEMKEAQIFQENEKQTSQQPAQPAKSPTQTQQQPAQPPKSQTQTLQQPAQPAKSPTQTLQYSAQRQNICPEHNMQFEDFCQQDQQLVCRLCKNATHKDHRMENLKNVIDIYEGKSRILGAQLRDKEQEVENNLNYIKTCLDCISFKKIQFRKYIQETITEMIRDLIVKRNQYQKQLNEWESEIQDEHLNLIQAWKYAKRQYNTADPFEVVKIEENLRKLDSLQSNLMNQKTLSQLEGYDPRNSVESIMEFKMKAEEELKKLKCLIFQSHLFTSSGSKEFQTIQTIKINSNQKISYNATNRKFNNAVVNIQPIDQNYTHIEQYQEEGLIISGGHNKNQKDFILLNKDQSAQYQMLNSRGNHRTKHNGNDRIYILSGTAGQ